jgi:hypothetical protein
MTVPGLWVLDSHYHSKRGVTIPKLPASNCLFMILTLMQQQAMPKAVANGQEMVSELRNMKWIWLAMVETCVQLLLSKVKLKRQPLP